MPSRWSIGEGHVGIQILEHIDAGVPGVALTQLAQRGGQLEAYQ